MPRISFSIFWKYKKNIRRDFISPWGRSAFCKLKIGSYHKKSVSHLLNRRLCQTVSQISSALGETHDSPGLFQFLTDFLKAGASVPWPMAKGCDCESFIGLASSSRSEGSNFQYRVGSSRRRRKCCRCACLLDTRKILMIAQPDPASSASKSLICPYRARHVSSGREPVMRGITMSSYCERSKMDIQPFDGNSLRIRHR